MKGERYYRFLNNLANPLRIQIMETLRSGEKSVGEITKELKAEQSKISHALISMKCCHIVEARQEGKSRIYSLNKETIVPIFEIIDKHAKEQCGSKCCACV